MSLHDVRIFIKILLACRGATERKKNCFVPIPLSPVSGRCGNSENGPLILPGTFLDTRLV